MYFHDNANCPINTSYVKKYIEKYSIMRKPIQAFFSPNKNSDTDIYEKVRSLLAKSEHIQPADICFLDKTDLTQSCCFGEEWLCVTNTLLLVFFVDNSKINTLHRFDLSSFSTMELQSQTGLGSLIAHHAGTSTRILYFTNANKETFSRAVATTNRLIQPADPNNPDAPILPPPWNLCDICKEPLPDGADKCPHCRHRGRTLLRVMDFAKPYTRSLVFMFCFMLLSTLCGLITPYISKLFIDVIFKPDAHSGLFTHATLFVPAVLLLFTAYAAQVFLSGVQERFSGSLGYKTVYDVRQAVYTKLQNLSLSYFDKHQTGGLLARVNQDTADLQRFIVDFFPITIQSLLMLFGVGAFLLVLSWRLTLFMIIPVVATVWFGKRIFPKVGRYFRVYFNRRSKLSSFVNDSLSGIRVVKAFGQEKREIAQFDKRNTAYRDSGVTLIKKWSVYHPLLQFFIMCGGVLVWAAGGKLILENRMTVGSVVAYAGYLAMFYQPLLMLARMVEMVSTSLSAAERVFAVIDARADVVDAQDAVAMPDIGGHVEFRNVSFGYNKFKPVIKNLSFSVSARELVGLVGKSGAGKSTIINLLCRLYDVDEGEILIDGVDIRKIKSADIRKQVGIVLQETFLFNGTIYDNIAYARPTATREQVIEAATAANVHDFTCEKPDGYDTEVGERGNMLSGGEKQRIAIARAILRDPAILILDEALSSVDTQTESKIQEALSRLTKNRTTIAIAHRLSTLRTYHRLFVIDNGECIESGTHEDLMSKHGAFYDLVTMQEKMSSIIDSKDTPHELS